LGDCKAHASNYLYGNDEDVGSRLKHGKQHDRSMQDVEERQLKSGKDVSADILMKISRELSAGKHQELQNRNDLWVLLISIVEEYVVRHRDSRQQDDDFCPQELSLTD